MSDIHALSGAYAVDALDDAERAQFERHLAECDICRDEVESLREAAALLAETIATPPPLDLRDSVLAQIATVRPLPPTERPGSVASFRPAGEPALGTVTTLAARRPRRFAALVAAAAAVIAIAGGGIVWQVLDDGPQSRTDQVISASDAERFTKNFDDGSSATLVRSKSLNEAVLITRDMADAPTGHAYALWLQHDDVMVPAGLMPAGPDNTVLLSGDAATADGAGITVETVGEDHPTPQGDVVALFEFEA